MTTHPEQPVHDLAIRLDEENRRLREALAAANARADKAEAAHDSCAGYAHGLVDALAAARRKRGELWELLREARLALVHWAETAEMPLLARIEAALAVPAAGEEKPVEECAGCRYGFSIGMDGRHWYTGGTGSNVSMDCTARRRMP